jgi:hypothetical protein
LAHVNLGAPDRRARTGEANLGILQGFMRDIRSTGQRMQEIARWTSRCSRAGVGGRRRIRHFAAALARRHQRHGRLDASGLRRRPHRAVEIFVRFGGRIAMDG